jgi:hypothetical protein
MDLNIILPSAKGSRILCRANKLRIHLLTAICVTTEVGSNPFFINLSAWYEF